MKSREKNYEIFPYVLLNIVILLFAIIIAISHCILIFSFKSARKLSKQSFFVQAAIIYRLLCYKKGIIQRIYVFHILKNSI